MGKLINLTKTNEDCICLLCSKNSATVKMEILRSKYGDSVISFSVCNGCLSQMQKDIETCD